MVVVLLVAVPLYPELFGLEAVTPFTQLAAFRPQGLALVLLLGVLIAVRRSWRTAGVSVALLAVVGGGWTAPRVLTSAGPAEPGTTELTIIAANVLGGGAKPAEVAELIRAQRPALVSLPEAQVDVRQDIERRLQGLGYRGYTHQANSAVESATSVLVSAELGDVRFDTDVLPGSTGVAGVGPQTTTEFGHVFVSGGRLGNLRLIAYHGFPPLPGTVDTWQQDLQVLQRWCADPAPSIIAGDFNATTDHADFRAALGSACRSVAPSVGKGLQGTWPADRPALLRTQIDHVVVSGGAEPVRFDSYRIVGSDHRAAVAVVAVPGG